MGESMNRSYGGGAGGVAQNIFLVHMTMSTGPLASLPLGLYVSLYISPLAQKGKFIQI